MDRYLKERALEVAGERISDARKLLNRSFSEQPDAHKPENILMCAQLIATEYNCLVIEKTTMAAADNLKSYLAHDF